jgi:F0F1-type ATP synthase assembly protein I
MKDKQPAIIGAGILAQLSFAIVTAMVLPLLAGIALSRYFNLGPLAVVAAMAVGILIGSLAVYRIVKDAYEQLGGGK